MTATTTLPVLFATGIHASRPAASAVGAGGLYSCTTHSLVYQTDGASTWSTWATLTGTGLTDPMTTRGDVIIRDASNVSARLATGAAGTYLGSDGTDTTFSAVTDAKLSTSDITTNNASTSKHGFLKKLDNNAAHFMDGTGAWSTPAGGGSSAFKVPIQEVKAASSSTNSLVATMASTPTNGNLLILGSENEGANNITSITQTNVTWTKVAESTASAAPHAEIWKGVVAGSAGTGITVAYSGSSFCGYAVAEFNGITGTLDQSATINGHVSSGKHNVMPSITPTSSSAIVFVAAASNTFGSSMNVFSTHYVQLSEAVGEGNEGYNGYGVAFGFPGTIPTYGVASMIHGGTFSGVIVSLT